MDGFERIEAILAKIEDAHKIWPEWFWPHCPVCGSECDKDASGDFFCWPKCMGDKKKLIPAYKFAPILNEIDLVAWHGTETDPRNMHHLWRILCHVDQRDMPEIWPAFGLFLQFPEPQGMTMAVIDRRNPDFCDAAIRALCLALGVE